ncbi:MAG: hypothetical protein ABW095_15100, partial [Candidatus Thiodiazotropha sp.]
RLRHVGFPVSPRDYRGLTASAFSLPWRSALDESLDKRNFRKAILARNIIHETGETLRQGNHRPAKTYRSINPSRVEILS